MSTSRSFDNCPKTMTSDQVADLLGHPAAGILVWVRDGKLPARKQPGSNRWWFDRDEVIGWMKSETSVTLEAG